MILGLWPLAGITSPAVDHQASLATIRAAIDAGVNVVDTAYSYGYDGESDRVLAEVLRSESRQVCVIGKVAQRWTPDRRRIIDASPTQLVADAEASLARIGIESFDLLMLHSVDPAVDIRRSAEALVRLRDRGMARAIGVCNASIDDLRRFAEVHVPTAVQLPLNILQRHILDGQVPWCRENRVQVHIYWGLMKGILAGRIGRDHVFAAGDSRPKYAVYQGEMRERAHQFLDNLAAIGARTGLTVAQLSIGWVLSQPGITAALVGAKRPEQIVETAASRPLPAEIIRQIDEASGQLHV